LYLRFSRDAQTKLRKPTNLKALTDAIDKLDWFSARALKESFGLLQPVKIVGLILNVTIGGKRDYARDRRETVEPLQRPA